jgi:hypothetical protein
MMTSMRSTLALLVLMSLCAAVVYTAEDVVVWVEAPENTAVRVFHVRRLLAHQNSLVYPSLSPYFEGQLTPLGVDVARHVWAIPGIASMNIGRYYVLVEKAGAFTWEEIIPFVTKVVEETLNTHVDEVP